VRVARCARERAHEERQALDVGEAPDAQEHRAAVRERRDLGVGVAERPLVLSRPPATRLLDEVAAPVGCAIDGARREAVGVEAVRADDAAARIDAEQRLDAFELAR
jgi:hypothetical protein